eukprot:TRINITY_DN76712_c0_g1_i1.p1 TRINITY_DN76712_c0_g1~~TRINITY_DN76712_c0_g1_i1.p1  ORF type:complete len:190 (+),score=19.08 TRINITY_DN76712_c0_g1_i1:36-572(+)
MHAGGERCYYCEQSATTYFVCPNCAGDNSHVDRHGQDLTGRYRYVLCGSCAENRACRFCSRVATPGDLVEMTLSSQTSTSAGVSLLSQTSASVCITTGSNQELLDALRKFQTETLTQLQQNQQLLKAVVGEIHNINSRVSHLEEVLVSSHRVSACGRCLPVKYRLAATSQDKCCGCFG